MSLELELFQAILANPDDIAPRLIYADWCDEQDDPRGEFIRIQCELAAYEGLPIKVRHLREREAELWKKHRRAWNGEIHRRLAATPLKNSVDSRNGLIRSWEYHRGFVESSVVEAKAFLECPEAIFQIGPMLQLRFIRVGDQLTQILHSPHLQRLKAVELSMPNEPDDIAKRKIQLNRPDNVAQIEIHPTGCLPSTIRPLYDRYPWRNPDLSPHYPSGHRPLDYGDSRRARFELFNLIAWAIQIAFAILVVIASGYFGVLSVVAFVLALLVSISVICGRL